jgi:hypothetical protein
MRYYRCIDNEFFEKEFKIGSVYESYCTGSLRVKIVGHTGSFFKHRFIDVTDVILRRLKLERL